LCSTPLAWVVMQNWLNDFAHRITLSWWVFALPNLVVILIALLTVSALTLKTALTNPARSLKYE
jgi:putative ABC transport system permease protein